MNQNLAVAVFILAVFSGIIGLAYLPKDGCQPARPTATLEKPRPDIVTLLGQDVSTAPPPSRAPDQMASPQGDRTTPQSSQRGPGSGNTNTIAGIGSEEDPIALYVAQTGIDERALIRVVIHLSDVDHLLGKRLRKRVLKHRKQFDIPSADREMSGVVWHNYRKTAQEILNRLHTHLTDVVVPAEQFAIEPAVTSLILRHYPPVAKVLHLLTQPPTAPPRKQNAYGSR